jgi:hypothetical protein
MMWLMGFKAAFATTGCPSGGGVVGVEGAGGEEGEAGAAGLAGALLALALDEVDDPDPHAQSNSESVGTSNRGIRFFIFWAPPDLEPAFDR